MKRVPLVLTVGFLVILGISTLVYHYFFEKVSTKIWDIIPSQAVMVVEIGECQDCLDQIKSSSFWNVMSHLIIRNKRADSLDKIFNHVLDPANRGFVSIHTTQKDDFDFVYYLPSKEFISTELKKWQESKSKYHQREFNGTQINELSIGGSVFSWTTFENIWIGSFTPVLLEDVIRTYTSESDVSFKAQVAGAYQLPRIKNDAGNLYFNFSALNKFLSVFLSKNFDLPALGKSALLDIKRLDNSITLNGFSIAGSTTPGSVFPYFSDQSPVPFGAKQFVSNRSIIVANYGISDGLKLFNALSISENKKKLDSLQSLTQIDFNSLFSGLGREITLCLFESRGMDLSKVALFDSSNPKEWLDVLDRLSKASEQEDSVYFEKYASYDIREIEIRNFPERLFSPLIKGFDQTYYTSIGKTIIMADQVEELRRFLNDIDKEEVWGKSVSINQFLESTLLESNISIYINTPHALSAISSKLNPKWRELYTKDRKSISALGYSAYQFSHLNESFYTNITWSYDSEKETRERQHAPVNRINAAIDLRIISKPIIAKNHLTKQDEFIVQDSLYGLHYFSSDGKRQWKKDVAGKIIDKSGQLDYLNNNKLQLFFFANGRLHVIDRLGNYVNPFPVPITQPTIEFVSLIDYDNSKRYRFLLTDKLGKLWLFDKEGKGLDGWKPRNVEGPLFSAPNHHRIRGKDFILAIRKDGWAYLMTRKGENVKGFPLNLEVQPEGVYFLEPGNSLATSYFVVVGKDGTKIKFNVEGKIISRELLAKAAIDDRFSLVSEKNQKAYLIKRHNSRQLTLFDEAGKALITNDFIGNNTTEIQYYDFGAGRTYIVLSDLSQDLCYLYDGQGNLLTPAPLDATGVSVVANGERITIVRVHEKSLIIEPLIK